MEAERMMAEEMMITMITAEDDADEDGVGDVSAVKNGGGDVAQRSRGMA